MRALLEREQGPALETSSARGEISEETNAKHCFWEALRYRCNPLKNAHPSENIARPFGMNVQTLRNLVACHDLSKKARQQVHEKLAACPAVRVINSSDERARGFCVLNREGVDARP
jgi:hypothetical protein